MIEQKKKKKKLYRLSESKQLHCGSGVYEQSINMPREQHPRVEKDIRRSGFSAFSHTNGAERGR